MHTNTHRERETKVDKSDVRWRYLLQSNLQNILYIF